MKKLLTKILIGALAVITLLSGLTACSSSSDWDGTTMTNWGGDVAGATQGGFIYEKENYYYFINGVGSNLNDNTFGVPVKGALVAVDKNDFTKTEVVVPKLFVAEDYTSGLFIDGDYVYYGTPNTDIDSQGDVAITEVTFMRTKLDGTDTTKFFTLGTIIAQHRFVKVGDDVLIVYYDSEALALEAYNCNTGKTDVIAKTDAEVEGKNGESLNAYMFAEVGSENVVYYTTTVYAEEYNETKVEKGEERNTENYNKVYAYKAGADVNNQVAILDGSLSTLNPATYEMKLVKFGKLYFSETINEKAKTYVLDGASKTRIYNESAIVDTTLFVENKVYTYADTKITESTLGADYKEKTKIVATGVDATTLVTIKDGMIYFAGSDGVLSRIKYNDDEAKVQQVSSGTIYVKWYPITFMDGKVFYCDNSDQGASYVKYIDISATAVVKGEDTDDDGEDDKFYLEGEKTLGIITDEDKVTMATAIIDNIAGKLVDGALDFETDSEGKLYVEAINEAVALAEGVELSESTEELLDTYKLAIEKANLYNKLEGIRIEVNALSFETAYNEVKAQIEAFRASSDYASVSKYIGNNRLWNYQRAQELFEKE